MSLLIQVEQTTPSTPSANQQQTYPKVAGLFVMDSAGTERQIITTVSTNSAAIVYAAQVFYLQNFGGL